MRGRRGVGWIGGGLLVLAVTSDAASLPSVDAPVPTGQKRASDFGVVIGVEDYAKVPDVPYARRDAQAFYRTLISTVGVPTARVRLLDRDVTAERILAAVEEAGAQTRAGGRVWIYFAGHGAADPSTGERLLLADDVTPDPAVFAARAVALSALKAKATSGGGQALLVVDACYNGASRSGQSLTGGKRMVVPDYARSAAAASAASAAVVEWAAAGPEELSGPLDAAQHGAFTFFALGALRGWADGAIDGKPDGRVTLEEAQFYVTGAMSSAQITTQRPVLTGGGEGWVASTGARERAPDLSGLLQPPPSAPAPATPTTGGDLLAELEQLRKVQAEREKTERDSAAKLAQDLAAARQAKQADAARQYGVVKELAAKGGPEAELAARKFIEAWRGATVNVRGQTEAVEIPEVALAQALLAQLTAPKPAPTPEPKPEPKPAPTPAAPVPKATSGARGYPMVQVPAGWFIMGSPTAEEGRAADETPHRVELRRPLLVGATEVTQSLWAQVMGENPNASRTDSDGMSCAAFEGISLVGPDLPVTCVSWLEAVLFANALSEAEGLTPAYNLQSTFSINTQASGYRLPTEAEWEYVARAGRVGQAWIGGADASALCTEGNLTDAAALRRFPDWVAATSCDDRYVGPSPAGRFAPNPWGLYDLSGNAREWVWDWYGKYTLGTVSDPRGPSSGEQKVVRGSAWDSTLSLDRVAARGAAEPGDTSLTVGLRLVRTPSAP